MVIQLLNILGKIVREHFVDSVLVAVSNGSIVVPALKAEHIKRLLKTLNFLFYGFFLIFKKPRVVQLLSKDCSENSGRILRKKDDRGGFLVDGLCL